MNKIEIAREIEKMARLLTASTGLSERIENAKYMFEAGGRGIELGIREIYFLSKESEKLNRDLRKIQDDYHEDPKKQEKILEEFNKRR